MWTVGTATEINDYLRLLYARVGVPYCPNGHGAIQSSSVEQIVDEVLALPERTRMQILAPIVRRRKGQHKAVFERVQKDGYVRVRVDGEIYDVTEVPELSKSKMHNIEVVALLRALFLSSLWLHSARVGAASLFIQCTVWLLSDL